MPPKKQSQNRTKGNVKPSSSAQAAQLLAASGQAPTGFIGFSSQPAFVPASEVLEESDSHLDNDFRLVLRKFSKRDTTTKIKALNEFRALCSDKPEASVKPVVPFWPRIYNKLAIDFDHKVRELSQLALSALATKVSKAMAPQLKTIMGAWLASQCDTYPTVASAAVSSFETIFPSKEKQVNVLRFCKEEVIEYLISNVIKQTPQTLSDPLTSSQEDMDSKYHQVVTSALHALHSVVTSLTPGDLADLCPQLMDLLNSPIYWKHAKSTVSMIKTGTVRVLTCVTLHFTDISSHFLPKTCPLVIASLNATDPSLMAAAWESLLCLLKMHDNVWDHVNWQKAAWPAIKHCLESGCQGRAEVISPWLLPLLDKLPERNFDLFLEAFRIGFSESCILNSPSACSRYVRSFLECVQYSVAHTINSQADNKLAVVRGLVEDYVIVLVKASLTHPRPGLSRTDLYTLMTPVMTSLHDLDPATEAAVWADLSTFVVHYLHEQCQPLDSESPPDTTAPGLKHITQRLPQLANSLVYQPQPKPSGRDRVRFATSGSDRDKPPDGNPTRSKRPLSAGLDGFYCDMMVAVYILAGVKGPQSRELLRLFKDLSVTHIPPSAPARLMLGADDPTANILADLGTTLGDCQSVEMTFADLHLEDQMQAASWRFMCQHLVPRLVDSSPTSPSLVDVQLACVLETFFAFFSLLEEIPGANFLVSLVEKMMQLDSLPVCHFLKKVIDLSTSVPACQKFALDHMSQLGLHLQTLVKLAPVDSSTREHKALWALLTAAMPLTEDTCTLNISNGKAITEAYVTMLVTLLQRSKDNCGNIDEVMRVARLAREAFTRKQLKSYRGSPELREMVECLLSLQLQILKWEPSSSLEFESILKTGLQLIFMEKEDESLNLVCGVIKTFVRQSNLSLDGLARVTRTVETLFDSYSSHVRESPDGRHDTVEHLTKLEKTLTKTETTSHDSATLDNAPVSIHPYVRDKMTDELLVDLVQTSVAEEQDILQHLFIKGTLSQPPQTQIEVKDTVSLESYALMCLHNLRLVNLFWDNSPGAHALDDPEVMMRAMSELVYSHTVLNTAQDLEMMTFPSSPQIQDELRSGLLKHISSLTQAQAHCLFSSTSCCEGPDMATLVRERQLSDNELYSLRCSLDVAPLLVDQLISAEGSIVRQSMRHHHCVVMLEILRRRMDNPKDVINTICPYYIKSSNPEVSKHYSKPLDLTLFSVSELSALLSASVAAPGPDKSNVMVTEADPLCAEVDRQLKQRDLNLLTSGVQAFAAEELHLNTSLARYLGRVFETTDAHWDLTLCTMVEWVHFLCEADLLECPGKRALLVAVTSLAGSVARVCSLTSEAGDSGEIKVTPTFQVKAATEWKEFFCEAVFTPLLGLFVKLSTKDLSHSSAHWAAVLSPLSDAIRLCPPNQVLMHQLPARLTVSDISPLPDSLKTVINHLAPLLRSSHAHVQDAAFTLLWGLTSEIAIHHLTKEEEESKEDDSGKEEEEEMCSPPEALIECVDGASHFLDGLMVAGVGEQQEVEVGEVTLTRGYLLSWMLLLQVFKVAPNLLRAKFAAYYKKQESVNHLLDHLFRLMPPQVDDQAALGEDFEVRDHQDLPTLAVSVYSACLLRLPALVRQWWTDQDRKSANYVDKFTLANLSQSLIVQQIKMSFQGEDKLEGFSIQARPQIREVTAVYEMAEVSVTLCITLPENFPLGRVSVTCDKVVGVASSTWDRWLMQLMIFLQHQNGNIEEGLRLWKGNIDKKLQGIEECMICFSVIHGTSFQLPRIRCRTCKKKFHSSCLYRWFSTSQKSTCPLCREIF